MSYSRNLLHGTKSVALESQLQLSSFLNMHHIGTSDLASGGKGSVVVAVCCQSQKGADTVKGLIQQYRGDTIVVMIARALIPIYHDSSKSSGSLFDVAEGVHEWCLQRQENTLLPPLKCVLVNAVSTESWRLPYLYAEGSVSAVYLDHTPRYEEYLTSLRLWYKRLANGGLLMGSQYSGETSQERASKTQLAHQSSIHQDAAQVRGASRHDVKAAVGAFTSEVLLNVLATYLERDDKYCWSDFNEYDASSLKEYYYRHCSPAWYLFRV